MVSVLLFDNFVIEVSLRCVGGKLSNYPYPDIKYYPSNAVLEMSLLCNMRCRHCGSRAGIPRKNELSIAEWLHVAQQLIDMGVEHVTLIGGEIFFIKDWDIVALKFAEAGVETRIITNAYQINDEEIKKIKTSKIASVSVSLDGFRETHNNIRGKKDSFEKAVNAFDRFNTEKIAFAVVTTLLDSNFHDLEEMYNLILAKGAFCWQLQLASPMGNASEQVDFLINPNKVHTLIEFIKEKKKLGKLRIEVGDNLCYKENCTLEESYHSSGHNKWFGCMAGLFVIGIDSIGNVKGCESLYSDKFIEGNIRNESLYDIWNKKGAFAYNRDFKPEMLGGKCKSCDKSAWCAGGCRQLSYFTSGSCHESIYCNYVKS